MNAAALAAALSGIGGGGGTGRAGQMEKAPGPTLAEVLNPETIIPLMRQPGMLEQLSQYLPVSPPRSPTISLHNASRPCTCVQYAWEHAPGPGMAEALGSTSIITLLLHTGMLWQLFKHLLLTPHKHFDILELAAGSCISMWLARLGLLSQLYAHAGRAEDRGRLGGPCSKHTAAPPAAHPGRRAADCPDRPCPLWTPGQGAHGCSQMTPNGRPQDSIAWDTR